MFQQVGKKDRPQRVPQKARKILGRGVIRKYAHFPPKPDAIPFAVKEFEKGRVNIHYLQDPHLQVAISDQEYSW